MRSSVAFALLVAFASAWTVRGQYSWLFDEKRPANFWDGAAIAAFPPENLKPRFESLRASKYVWNLMEGNYSMPYHMSRVPFNVSLQVVGQGVNKTIVDFAGYQQVLVLAQGSYIEFVNVTISGMTVGYFYADTPTDVAASQKPRWALFHSEFWAVTSDTQASSGNFLATYVRVALLAEALVTIGSSADLKTDVLYETNPNRNVYPPGKFFAFETKNTVLKLGILNAYFEDVVQRETPDGFEMQVLYNNMVRDRGEPFSLDCWNATPGDVGFTYRGTVSRTLTGFQCKNWTDPSAFPNNNLPAEPGRFSGTEANYCRSPRFWWGGPWCYTTNPDRKVNAGAGWELCDIPVCPGTNLTEVPDSGGGGGSSGMSIGGILGLVAAGVVVLALILAGVWCFFRKRQVPVVIVKEGENGEILDTKLPQLWHITRPFETILTCPFMKEGMEINSASVGNGISPGDLGALQMPDPSSFKPQVLRMMDQCRSVDSLAVRDLEYKYGPVWAAENEIDSSRLIGSGGIGKVYAGRYRGEPVAYKVINQLKTPDAMLRFVRKCVLPVVNVQLLPSFPTHHQHLLQLRDCLMFPQYSSLLLLADAGDEFMVNQALSYIPGANSLKPDESLKPGARASKPSPASITSLDLPAAVPFGSMRLGSLPRDAQPKDPLAAGALKQPTAVEPTWAASGKAVELPDEQMRARGAQPPAEGAEVFVDPVNAPDQLLSTSVYQTCPPTQSVNPNGVSNGENRVDGSARNGSHNFLTASHTPRSADSTRTKSQHSDGESQATRDIVVQIIMVSPLCELGTLTDLLRCRTQIPVRALPEKLQGMLSRLVMAPSHSVSLNVGDVQVTIDEDGPTIPEQLMPVGSAVAIQELPTIWQLILKLQLSLQVLEGVSALHAVSLIHCDIKLDNIFITYSEDFAPFRVCAKVGDLDTCRSLTGAHLTNDLNAFGLDSMKAQTASTESSSEGSVSLDFDPHTHFTSCLKGTPGFLAPEMISIGRVSSETDIFSLAVTISIMLSVRSQFYKLNDLHLKLVTDFYRELDEDLKNTLTECLNLEPSRRPRLSVLKAHLQKQLDSCLERATSFGEY